MRFLRWLFRDLTFLMFAIMTLGGVFLAGIGYELHALLRGEFAAMLNWKAIVALLAPALVYPLDRLAFLANPELKEVVIRINAVRKVLQANWGQRPQKPSCQPHQDDPDRP